MPYIQYICVLQKQKKGKYLLFSKYGGIALTEHSDLLEEHAYHKPHPLKIDNINHNKIMKALNDLKPAIIDLNSHDIYHNDLSFDNILYNDETEKAYMIDFDRSTRTPPPPLNKYGNKNTTDLEQLEILIEQLESMKKLIDNYHSPKNKSRKKSPNRSRNRSTSRKASRSRSRNKNTKI
jgi:serine/threonine protein kinase